MNSKESDRRRFLKGIALAGLAAGTSETDAFQTAGPAHPEHTTPNSERSRFVTSERKNDYDRPFPAKQLTPIQDLMGIITPNHLHFVADHSHPPDIDPTEYRFTLHGMVDHPLTFTLDELKRFPSESRIYFVECEANSMPGRHRVGGRNRTPEAVDDLHGRTSCSEWTGVLLSVLLKSAGVKRGASWIVSEGSDSGRYAHSLPLAKALDDVLVAYGQNGEPLRPEHGYPVRLLVPGFRGPESVKWLRQIKVVDEPYMTKEDVVHTERLPDRKVWFSQEVPLKSVILRPSLGQQLPGRGFYEITGLAWSGAGAIRRVEVSVDNGRSWNDAKLQDPVHRFAHTRFRLPWTWSGEETVLQSRCTDERGQVQPTIEQLSAKLGVPRDYWKRGNITFFNVIQPWKIDPDGRVHDAMAL